MRTRAKRTNSTPAGGRTFWYHGSVPAIVSTTVLPATDWQSYI